MSASASASASRRGGILPPHSVPAPGEIWAVTGEAATRSAWCRRFAGDDEYADTTALLSFAQQAGLAQTSGWPQARYYEDDGKTVDEFLAYESVYEINPFEIGAKRPESKKAYRARKDFLMRLLELRALADRPLLALSNGETRRALLAFALAKGPKLLILDDPAAGLDVRQRAKLREILTALAARGLAIIMTYRHADELPEGVTAWLKIGDATPRRVAPPKATPPARKQTIKQSKQPKQSNTPPVISIANLTVTFGARTLFDNFAWTVRKGERWILRGENGSGKTTLFALITGDSPLAYAADVTVFGIARDTGCELRKIRERIGVASPELQACTGKTANELIDEALSGDPELLLLDEPFLNLDEKEAKRLSRKLASYLRAHKDVTAILICHRDDEAPRCFTRELNLGDAAPRRV